MSCLLTNQRLFFLHIPRTGGTWVKQALGILNIRIQARFSRRMYSGAIRLSTKHCLLSHYLEKEHSRWDTSFAFVRHPIEYYETVWGWIYLSVHHPDKRKRFCWHPFTIPYDNWDKDFNVWIKTMLEKYPGWVSHLFDLYVGPQGGEFCKYIGRMENLVDDFCAIMEDYNLLSDELCNIEKQNIRQAPKIVWDEGLKRDVEVSESSAINRFYGKNLHKLRYGIRN